MENDIIEAKASWPHYNNSTYECFCTEKPLQTINRKKKLFVFLGFVAFSFRLQMKQLKSQPYSDHIVSNNGKEWNNNITNTHVTIA